MVERGINVARSHFEQSCKFSTGGKMCKSPDCVMCQGQGAQGATKVAPSNDSASIPDVWRTRAHASGRGVILSADDASLARELALFAAESMQAVIDWELRTRGERPILQVMRAYVRDARALLKRIT